jgi:hypothetical protein
MRRPRVISGSFWTAERDERLRRLEAEGLSAAKIAAKLGTTRDAVLGRSHRLSGASLTYPSYLRLANEARARKAARRKKQERLNHAALSKIRQETARGIGRDRAIVRARKAGATLKAIGDVFGITRERVRQIVAGSRSVPRRSA